jgi:23S rRNA (adenine2503-C2)-methyltransferase
MVSSMSPSSSTTTSHPVTRSGSAPDRTAAGQPSLLGELPPALAETLAGAGVEVPPYRTLQIFRWLHARGAREWSAMTDLPAALREDLGRKFRIAALAPVDEAQSSETRTRKFVLAAPDGARIESVRITTPHRVTLCLSSQVGCGFGCGFCRTAQMGYVRQLTAAEIVDQVHWIHKLAPLPPSYNLVFMGMGEPLANYDQVGRAIDILVHREGLAITPWRITVSTVGLAPEIERLGRERPRVRLAISLTATTDELRNRLVPVNRRYPLARLMAAAKTHARLTGQRVTFEYVVLAGVNDRPADARRLSQFANEVPSKVNLIPYNATGLEGFTRATPEAMQRFADYLAPRIYAVTIRQSQGKDIFAACGQLAQPRSTPRKRRR